MAAIREKFKLYNLIVYSGAATFLFLTATVILGITRYNFKLHKLLGKATIGLACLHLGLGLYKNMKHRFAKQGL